MQKPTKPTNGDTKPPNGESQPIIKTRVFSHYLRCCETCVFSPFRHSKPRRTRWSHHRFLSQKVFKFWMFWFTLCCVLGLRGVFVTVGLEVGYGDWRKHTTGGLSDTFQTTGRYNDFHPNYRWVMCNYPLDLLWINLVKKNKTT